MKRAFVFLFLMALPAMGANHFVRQGATGTGSGADWTNAFTQMPTSLVRGDTYYVGNGSYSPFSDPSGTSIITVRKCTATDGVSSTTAGYQASYCNGQAVFTGEIDINYGNIVMDGITGGGPSAWRSGHGFKITGAGGTKGLYLASGTTNVTIRHTEITHGQTSTLDNDDGIYVITLFNNLTMQYMWIHNMGRTCILTGEDTPGTGGVLLEYSICELQYSGAAHGEGWADNGTSNVTVRYNLFWNNNGTANISNIGRGQTGHQANNWYIYGNIFGISQGNPNGASISANLWCNEGPSGSDAVNCSNWIIANNTFIGASSSSYGFGAAPYPVPTTPRYLWNNLWVSTNGGIIQDMYTGDQVAYNSAYNSSYVVHGVTETNRETLSSNPIANWTGQDFHLTGPTAAGINTNTSTPVIPTTYGGSNAVDMYGTVRGADGVWDRGAIEYGSGSANAIIPPTNLSTVVR